jgi:hypothetical protein
MERNSVVGLKAGHTRIMSIGLRRQVRTYPSHSTRLYTLNPKCAGCEYPTIPAGGMGFRCLLQYVGTAYVSAYVSGHTGMAELNGKALIGGSKTKMSEQSRVDWNNRNKN